MWCFTMTGAGAEPPRAWTLPRLGQLKGTISPPEKGTGLFPRAADESMAQQVCQTPSPPTFCRESTGGVTGCFPGGGVQAKRPGY